MIDEAQKVVNYSIERAMKGAYRQGVLVGAKAMLTAICDHVMKNVRDGDEVVNTILEVEPNKLDVDNLQITKLNT